MLLKRLAASVLLASPWTVIAPAAGLWAGIPEARSSGARSTGQLPGQVLEINRHIRQVWRDARVRASEPAPDGEWCRRLFLDLLGRIPTVEELERFEKDGSASKRDQLVSELLYGSRYRDEFARNWSTIWANLLVGRSPEVEREGVVRREGFERYLHDALAENRPYDHMVEQLLSASGSNVPGEPDYNGAVNFLVGKLDNQAIQATGQTARFFLGLQVQCTQCHNHPFNEWKQEQFWQLNSFFRQAAVVQEPVVDGGDDRLVRLMDRDFFGEDIEPSPEQASVFYELRNGRLAVAYPVFVDGTAIGRDGRVDRVHRRRELARLIVGSSYFLRAVVNRLWAHFLGYGFTRPVDDMGPHNPPSHPELLDYLAQQLKEHNFDLKQLMMWIVLSEPYARSSRIPRGSRGDDPRAGDAPKFSYFYTRQMRAEELYDSVQVASGLRRPGEWDARQTDHRDHWLRQFTIAYGTDEGDELTMFNGTIPQTLMMFNGELLSRATRALPGTFLHRVVWGKEHPSDKVDQLFLAALSRRPSKAEREAIVSQLVARQADPAAGWEDLWWALLNSNEFILNH